MNKPFSPSSERNREPIEQVLATVFAQGRHLLEIGSGSGQHAVYFSQLFPHLIWQCSDRAENLPGIRAWVNESPRENLPPPIELDVNQTDWPEARFDCIFSANTLHIMAWEEVRTLFRRLPEVLADKATVVCYGPFKYAGQHTSPSNAAFEARLQSEDPSRGIRDFEAVDALADAAGLRLLQDHAMPANNRCLVWRKTDAD